MIFIIVLVIFSLDQLTKILITKNLFLYQSVPVIKNIFHITLVRNTGAAFGMFKNQLYLFIFTSIGAIVLILLDLKERRGKKLDIYSLSLAFILAGASGNLVDRIRFGCVIDFLDFRIWPVFNIADSAITIGAALLGWKLCIR